MSMTIDWGDGSAVQNVELPAGATTFNIAHRYFDNLPNNAPYTITAALAGGEAAEGAWSTAASMLRSSGIDGGTAAAPIDGKWYVSGDWNGASLQAYDLATDTWSMKTPIPDRQAAGAGGVIDGKLYYAAGGFNSDLSCPTNRLLIYDPATDTWATGPAAPTARFKVTGVAVGEKLYVMGGLHRTSYGLENFNTLEIYDAASHCWSTGAPMPTALEGCKAEMIGDKIYVVGGFIRDGVGGYTGHVTDALAVYDPATGTWTTAAPMPTPREGAATAVVDGKLYVAGGRIEPTGPSSSCATDVVEVYDPATNSWTTAPSLTTARWLAAGIAMDGKFYVAGGTTNPIYTPATSTKVFTPASSSSPSGVSLVVENVAPDCAIAGDADGTIGQSLTFTVSSADASPVDQAAGFDYHVDWGDGTCQDVPCAAGNGAGVVLSHVYATPQADYAIQATVVDKDGAASAPVILNVAITELPSFVVTTTDDLVDPYDGLTSLREAINYANNNPGDDTITFTVTGTINLGSVLPNLASNINIVGPGADQLAVRRDTGGSYRVFTVDAGATVGMSGLTISNGSAYDGGGIYNAGTLTVNASTVSANSAGNDGGGIYSAGTLEISNSLIVGNRTPTFSTAYEGGGIYSDNYVTVMNCTISGNWAGAGAGIMVKGGTATILSSTIASNTAHSGGGINNYYSMYHVGIQNTIVAGNTATGGWAPDVGNGVDSAGHNLVGNASASGGWNSTDLLNENPLLAPLDDYGGATRTMPLLPGSPAIDAADASGAPVTDQRGVGRDASPDIGAFESRGFTISIRGGDGQSTPVGEAYPQTLSVTVSSAYGEPVAGGEVTFAAPALGASAILTGTLASIAADGQSAITAMANCVPGSYPVAAGGNGIAIPAAFVLSNYNRAPVAEANGLYTVAEGEDLLLDATGSYDPDACDSIVEYAWDLNNDGSYETVSTTGATLTVSWATLTALGLGDGPIAHTISLRVTDSFGAAGTDAVTLEVTNAAPTLSSLAVTSHINEGDVAHLTGMIDDPGTQDTLTLAVDWGDGSGTETFVLGTGTAPFDVTHRYLNNLPGDAPYTLSVSVTDDDGGIGGHCQFHPVKVSDVEPLNGLPEMAANVEGTLFFVAADGEHGPELWKSDGTNAGTVLVKDIWPGPEGASLTNLTNVNGRLFFTAADPEHGMELWTSDGSEAGTYVIDIMPGLEGSDPHQLTDFNGALFFAATDPVSGTSRLWKSDGLTGVAVVSERVQPMVGWPAMAGWPNNWVAIDDVLYFPGIDANADQGVELWRTDGTAAGTWLVKDIVAGPDSSAITALTRVGERLLFVACEPNYGTELWTSDGTEAGTEVIDLIPGPASAGVWPYITSINGAALFTMADPNTGMACLWRSDGSLDGTTKISDVMPMVGTWPFNSVQAGDNLYFPGLDLTADQGYELWRTDGTAAGTVLVKDVIAGPQSSLPMWSINVGDRLFFAVSDPDAGMQLWTSDGTASGTQEVDISPAYSAWEYAAVDDVLFFAAVDPSVDGYTLWKVNSGVEPLQVIVNNVAPTIVSLAATPTIDENGVATLQGTFTDPGTQDSYVLVVNWGEGTPQTIALAAGVREFTLTHQYCDDDPAGTLTDNYAIQVNLSDDGGSAVASATTTVCNVAPTISQISSSSPGVGDAKEGERVNVSFNFADLGTRDTHTAVIDWGDGTTTVAGVSESAGSGTVAGSHAYAEGGIYTVIATVKDDDGGTIVATTSAVVSGMGVHDGVLQIIGTRGDDRINVDKAGGKRLEVQASFLPKGGKRTFDSTDIDEIVILLGDGDDRAVIAGSVRITAVIDGGAGDDRLNGGGGANIIFGDAGDDQLLAGGGGDVLIGGLGRDRIIGNGGGDILVAGTTTLDFDDAALTATFDRALLAVLAEWNSIASYRARVARVSTMFDAFDDGAKDTLTGCQGRDWFFGNLKCGVRDKITDLKGNEIMEEL